MKQAILLFVAVVALSACHTKHSATPEKRVYYWKYNGIQNDLDTTLLQHYGFRHFYVKLMDIEYDPALKAVRSKTSLDNWKALEQAWSIPHTPVVFIHNNSFINTDSTGAQQLARDVSRYIKSYYEQLNILLKNKVSGWHTLQVDCDWTKATKDRYFYFLNELKALNPGIKLSATLRMYPYKYREQMGIPPVDELSLMCYNLGKIKEFDTHNSILDINEIKSYLSKRNAYPKPLHLALPCFGWMVWFRNGSYKHILYLSEAQLDTAHFARKENTNRYMVIKDTVVAGQYVRTGDILRSEWPVKKELEKTIELLSQKEKDLKSISYFHFDTTLLKQYASVIINHK